MNKKQLLSMGEIFQYLPIKSANKLDRYKKLRDFLYRKGREKNIDVFIKNGTKLYSTLNILQKLIPNAFDETIDQYKDQIEALKAQNKALKDKVASLRRRQ